MGQLDEEFAMATVLIQGYEFEGPIPLSQAPDQLQSTWSAFVVARQDSSRRLKVLDVGYAEPIGAELANHPRRACWEHQATGSPLVVYVSTADTEGTHRQAEMDIRADGNLACTPR
jgi:hypothetical protein